MKSMIENERLVDTIILQDDDLLEIRGGVEERINCGAGCGLGCGSSCGSGCSGCSVDVPEEPSFDGDVPL